ncbi:MAG TPA: carboxypeptidase-like regulatory domain-containing protein [Gemmataceae bacterium]|nr:carboxypeptidase-like regulatory domain-containing protein [Gemmataceae bacterium]
MTILILAFVPALSGCGKSTSQLKGQVTLNGSPVSYGQISAYNEKGDLLAQTRFVNGAYEFPDLPVGKATLTVQTVGPLGYPAWREPPPPPKGVPPLPKEVLESNIYGGLTDEEKAAAKSIVPVPKKYWSPKESGLSVDAKAGKIQFDIQMTGEGEKPEPPQMRFN